MVSFNLAFAYACAHSVVSDSVTRWTICSLPVSVHGIFQARILEWVAISSSTVCSKPRDRTHVSCIGRQILYHWCHLGSLALGLSKPASPTWWWWSVVSNSVTPWTATHQASLSFTISQSLFKFMSIESVMPSNHLTLCHPLLLLPSFFPRIRVFFNELSSSHQVAKVLELQLTVSYKRVISTWFSWLVCCPLFLKSNLAEIILMSRR